MIGGWPLSTRSQETNGWEPAPPGGRGGKNNEPRQKHLPTIGSQGQNLLPYTGYRALGSRCTLRLECHRPQQKAICCTPTARQRQTDNSCHVLRDRSVDFSANASRSSPAPHPPPFLPNAAPKTSALQAELRAAPVAALGVVAENQTNVYEEPWTSARGGRGEEGRKASERK